MEPAPPGAACRPRRPHRSAASGTRDSPACTRHGRNRNLGSTHHAGRPGSSFARPDRRSTRHGARTRHCRSDGVPDGNRRGPPRRVGFPCSPSCRGAARSSTASRPRAATAAHGEAAPTRKTPAASRHDSRRPRSYGAVVDRLTFLSSVPPPHPVVSCQDCGAAEIVARIRPAAQARPRRGLPFPSARRGTEQDI